MLTSGERISQTVQREMLGKHKPLPVCASATRASATKNSTLDTFERELTKLTIYIGRISGQRERFEINARLCNNHKFELTLSMLAAGKDDVARTRDSALTDISPELVGSTARNAMLYDSGMVASPD